jgi:FtsZ-binding cell division protein ZapB
MTEAQLNLLYAELARLQRDLEEITRFVNDTITERDALRKELTKVTEERQLWYERAIRLGSDHV